ncbi:MAG: deoxyribonuclease IV [Crenarchaeota archaeon]|nr:MAG: deoxyribonuclease IV [Thermoproteota archaeon]RDJ33402.1 MAG: deoxyribonuclease IV [Thermoproteota archaeon]RDJ36093.1 MAG: deoxyribonuclease IV [Thermoproteota archaeon]RDJ38726.1 MAG: deoxyribonuclease IV [Thermoproteota archaeon]
MQIGCHVSISGGVNNAVDNAVERSCSAFQIFTRNPRGWNAKELPEKEISDFKKKLKASDIERLATCAHMPYLPNLSSPKKDSLKKSVDAMINEVKRCGKLGIPYLVTHLGSHLGTGEEEGIKRLVASLKEVAEVDNDVMILLENTAGQKNSVGSEFEQLAEIFFELKPAKRFGICIDTCHAFVAGYDLRTEKAVNDTFSKFEKAIGFEHLKILHLNDAKGEIGSRLDRHYHIGLGQIGEKGMSAVIKMANKKEIPIILETPIDDVRDDFENIKKAKKLA